LSAERDWFNLTNHAGAQRDAWRMAAAGTVSLRSAEVPAACLLHFSGSSDQAMTR
jgi:hypothetical protein